MRFVDSTSNYRTKLRDTSRSKRKLVTSADQSERLRPSSNNKNQMKMTSQKKLMRINQMMNRSMTKQMRKASSDSKNLYNSFSELPNRISSMTLKRKDRFHYQNHYQASHLISSLFS